MGGAIFNVANLNLTNSTFAGNNAVGGNGGAGGGGYLGGCLPGNPNPRPTAGGGGGRGGDGSGAGLYSSNSNVYILHSTVSQNQALRGRGGLGGSGGNCYDTAGSGVPGADGTYGSALAGGIHSEGSSPVPRLVNSICAGNTAETGPDCFGPFSSGGHNLIGTTNDSIGWVSSDLTGKTNAPLNAELSSAQDNGGPTWTMALLPGSPAMDQGGSTSATTDQRGRLRPYDNPAITNATGGDGSDIGAFEFNPPVLSIARAAGNVVLSWPAYDTGYTLEAKTNLNSSINWSNVAGTLSIVSGQFTITNSATTGNKFYRLRSP